MLLAAKEEMFSTCSDPCVSFSLAAFEGIGENSRLGSATRKTALHRGRAWSNSARALGIEEVLLGSRVGCRSSGNSSGWWSTFGKTFLNGVLHGDRQPGQSFGACMDQNIKDTTFGTVDPKALTNKALVTAESTMVALGSIPVQTYVTSSGAVGTLNGISAGAIGVTRALGLGLGGSRVVIGALTGAGDALAVAGAATFGLVVGSAINCR
jgi:hypothetical protein